MNYLSYVYIFNGSQKQAGGLINIKNVSSEICLLIQGPPYILARHVMAIFSICTKNIQNIFLTKQGSRGSECLYLMVF